MKAAIPVLAAGLCLCVAVVTSAQEPRERMVIGTGVACRTEPRRDAASRRTLRLGELISATAAETSATGEVWLSANQCWVLSDLTAEFQRSNPEVTFLAAADRVLGRKDATFEELVAVDNLLITNLFGKDVLASSGLLQFRQLEIFRRIAELPESRDPYLDNPLKLAWFTGHRDVVRHFEPDAGYSVPVEAYWKLHDKYPREPWSEELAWIAAQVRIPSDECYSDCVFDRVERTYARYWKTHPSGKSVDAAIEKAIPLADYAVQMSLYDTPPQAILDRLRRSLDNVTSPAKTRFLNLLGEAARKYRP
jgi:hypothetical protein